MGLEVSGMGVASPPKVVALGGLGRVDNDVARGKVETDLPVQLQNFWRLSGVRNLNNQAATFPGCSTTSSTDFPGRTEWWV